MADNRVIRVLVADNHERMRNSLSVFLEAFDDLQLVGEAANCDDVLRLCREAGPQVILIDVAMPQFRGVSTIEQIRMAHPSIKVIALAGFGDQPLMREALRVGAFCTLVKDTSIDVLAAAIRAACGIGSDEPRRSVADLSTA